MISLAGNGPLNAFMNSVEDGIFMIGHSSALVRLENTLILMDPCWGDFKPYGNLWTFCPEQINCDEILPQIDFIILSHFHQDHFCPPILEACRAPIIIMSGREEFRQKLFGIDRTFTEVNPNFWMRISPGLECYFVQHPTNGVDSSFFVASEKTCVYQGNDNFLNHDQVEKLARYIGHVDFAMVPFAYVAWWPFLQVDISPEFRLHEINRLNAKCLGMGMDFKNTVKPDVTVPFGASLYYQGGHDHILNRHLLRQEDFPGAQPMYPGDYYLKGSGFARRPVNLSEELRSALGSESPERINTFIKPLHTYDLRDVRRRALMATIRIPEHQIIVNGVSINTESLEVSTVPRGRLGYTRWDFDRAIFADWVYGILTFEEAIGTRKFEFRRLPDVYDPKVFDFAQRFL